MADPRRYGKGSPFTFIQHNLREAGVVANNHHRETPFNSTFKGGGVLVLQKNCDYCDGKEYVFEKDTIRCTTCGVKYIKLGSKYVVMYKTIPGEKED